MGAILSLVLVAQVMCTLSLEFDAPWTASRRRECEVLLNSLAKAKGNVTIAEQLYRCAQDAMSVDDDIGAVILLEASTNVVALPSVLNDQGIHLRKLERSEEAMAVLTKALDALHVPFTSLDLELPTNTLSDVISGKGMSNANLSSLLNHRVIQHSIAMFPNVAMLASFSLLRHGAWWLQPEPELTIQDSAVRSLRTWLTWAGDGHAVSVASYRGTWVPPGFVPFPPNEKETPADKLGAFMFWRHELALNMGLQMLHDAYEMSYVGIHPALRWVLVGARGWGRRPYPKDIKGAIAVMIGAPRWYDQHRREGRGTARRVLGIKSPLQSAVSPPNRPRLRLAYVSGDLRRHAIGWMVQGIFASHNRSAVSVAAFNWGAVGATKPYREEFKLNVSVVSDSYEPDWSRSKPFHDGDFTARALSMGIRGQSAADVPASMCDARLWGHTSRLAAACDMFYCPGTWRTPRGYCATHHPGLCESIPKFVDVVVDAIDRLATEVRPHVMIDLVGLTQGGLPSVGHARPAPISVHWLSGSESMSDVMRADWKMVDTVVLPPEMSTWPRYLGKHGLGIENQWCGSVGYQDRHSRKCVAHVYTEALAYIPGPFQANTYVSAAGVCHANKMLGGNGPAHPLSTCHALSVGPACAPRRGYCGAQDRTVLIAFHSSFKIDPVVWEGWMNILRMHPSTVLWLLKHSALNPQLSNRVRANAASLGVHPSRIVFVDETARELHWRRMLCASMFLDAWNYGAHSSGADALRFGVPVLTLQRHGFASRVMSSLLSSWVPLARGLSHPAALLSAHSAMEVEHTAAELLAQRPERGHAGVRRGHGPSLRLRALKAQLWWGASQSQPHSAEGAQQTADPAPGPFAYTDVSNKLERAYRVMWEARAVARALRGNTLLAGFRYDIMTAGFGDDKGNGSYARTPQAERAARLVGEPARGNCTSAELIEAASWWDIRNTRRDFHIIVDPEHSKRQREGR